MSRVNRQCIPGCIWHITHRSCKTAFPLQFSKDRKRCLHWLFEAKIRQGLSVLNDVMTSSHINEEALLSYTSFFDGKIHTLSAENTIK